MHELSITEHLLADCIREAEAMNASRIRTIRLCIGQLRGIVPECIQIYLDMLAEGTIAEGARIESVWTAGRTAISRPIIWNVPTAGACGSGFCPEKNFISRVWR